MPRESVIVAHALAQGRALGYWCAKFHGSPFALAGVPDILAIRAGVACWMECKQAGKKPTRLQALRMRELEAAGCRVAVIHSRAEAKAFLQ